MQKAPEVLGRLLFCSSLSTVVLAKARTHNPREMFGEDSSFGTPTFPQSIDLAVWVLAFARTTPLV